MHATNATKRCNEHKRWTRWRSPPWSLSHTWRHTGNTTNVERIVNALWWINSIPLNFIMLLLRTYHFQFPSFIFPLLYVRVVMESFSKIQTRKCFFFPYFFSYTSIWIERQSWLLIDVFIPQIFRFAANQRWMRGILNGSLELERPSTNNAISHLQHY